MKKIRWGIVGPGNIAHQFANDIKFTRNAVLTAVASNSVERGTKFGDQYSVPKVYDSYEALYQDPDIDAIYVATTHNFHLRNSSQAMIAGKAVLCEKPLTDNLQDSIKLIELSNDLGIYLLEGLWTYFLPAIVKAKQWVEEGRIGKVINVKSSFGYPKSFDPESRLFNPALSGGSLLDMGIYTIAIAWLFLRDHPNNIKVASTKAPNGVDIDVNMLFEYEDAIANLHSSFRAKLNNHAYIIGEKGYIEIPDFWRANECLLYEEENVIDHFTDQRKGQGFEYEIEAASNDIYNGRKESTIVPHNYSLIFQTQIDQILSRI